MAWQVYILEHILLEITPGILLLLLLLLLLILLLLLSNIYIGYLHIYKNT